MAGEKVVPRLLAIPDGFDGGHVLITVQVVPWNAGTGAGIALDQWPRLIADLGTRMVLSVAPLSETPPEATIQRTPCESELKKFLADPHPQSAMTRAQAITKLWKRIFDTPGFGFLHAAVDSANNESNPMTVDPLTGTLREPGFRTSRTSDLSILLEAALAVPHARHEGEVALAHRDVLDTVFQRGSLKLASQSLHERTGDPFEEHAAELREIERFADQLKGAGTDPALLGALDSSAILAAQAAVAEFDEATDPEDPPVPDELEDIVEPPIADIDTARRKLSGIMAIPTLAHYFGLAIQLRVPAAALGTGNTMLRVQFVDAGGTPIADQIAKWTAFDYSAGASGHFVPADKSSGASDPGEFPYDQGLLKLSAEQGGIKRFRVDSRDVTNTLYRLRLALERGFEELKDTRRGIALFDRFHKAETLAAYRREAADAARTSGEPPIVYVRDMIMGLRPDIGVAGRTGATLTLEESRWRALTSRQIRCSDPQEDLIDPDFYKHNAIKRIAHHDHGLTVVPEQLKRVTAADGTATIDVVTQEELTVWAGESQGLSPANPGGVKVCPDKDLGISATYAIEPHGATEPEPLPPLREQCGYVFGARLVFPNGVSLRLNEATPRYATDATVLVGGMRPDGTRVPFEFPLDTVPAPQVHLPPDDPLVTAALAADRFGEAADRLVVRDAGPIEDESVQRLLFPPRITFDRAEAERQFDSAAQRQLRVPQGAFPGKVHVRTFGPDGAFPEARIGAIWYVSTDSAGNQVWKPVNSRRRAPTAPASPQSRGTVAIVSDRPSADDSIYYACKHGSTVVATLTRANLPTLTAPPQPGEVVFWSGENPNNALPAVIELVRSSTPGAAINPRPFKPVTVGGNRLPHLRIDLGKGEVYKLELKAKAATPSGAESVSLLLVHALQKPATAPAVISHTVPGGLGINPVTVTVRAPGTAGTLPTWEQLSAKLQGAYGSMLDWPSSEGGSISFFVGRVGIDCRTTHKLRCVATWEDYDTKRVTRSGDVQWVERRRSQTEKLFSLDIEDGDETWIDLLRDKAGKLRGLCYSFPDGRARRLQPMLIATSRFESYFHGETVPEDGGVQPWERTARIPDIWTECTFRPPPPRIDRAIPVFHWEQTRISAEKYTARRTARRIRFYLDEGWHASGEGEKLGIILKGDEPVPADSPFAPYLARAGADPARPGARERSYLDIPHFPGETLEHGPAPFLLYLNDEGADQIVARQSRVEVPDGGLPVKLIALDVQKDAQGELFCEIEIQPSGAYTPFVQLGLVRYQEHAVHHLKLSPAIQFQVQLLPERNVTIEGSGNRRRFTMTGPGYAGVAEPAGTTGSTIDLRVLRWDDFTQHWVAAPSRPTEKLDQPPRLQPDGSFVWSIDLTVPWPGQWSTNTPDHAEQVAVLIEEYEHLPTESVTGYDANGLAIFAPGMGKRLVFSHIQRIR